MTNKKNTKKALLMSCLSLLLCMSMLVGTTFAWFTDSVSSTNNIITAGNLDVNLYWSTNGTEWTPVDANTNIFKLGSLWEPGYTEVVYLKVVNEGTLALKYNLNVNVASETTGTNVYGEEFNLSDYILYTINDGVKTFANSAAARGDESGDKLNVPYGLSSKLLNKGESAELTMVVFMPTFVGNEANYLTDTAAPVINLGINLFATQYTYEEDSFDEFYDGGAAWTGEVDYSWYDPAATELTIGSSEQLAGFAAITNGTATDAEGNAIVDDFAGKTIKLISNIDLANRAWTPIADGNSEGYVGFAGTFDGQGHVISNLYVSSAAWGQGLFGYMTADVSIKNFTVNNAFVESADELAAVVAAYSAKGTFSNIHVTGDVTVIGASNVGGIVGYGKATNFDNCSVVGSASTYAARSVGGSITATTGSFAGGIVGYNGEGVSITGCSVENMNITAYTAVGGVVGSLGYGSTVDGCSVKNVVLNKTRVDGNPAIGIFIGCHSYNANNAITLTNNVAANVTLNGTAVEYAAYNELYGSDYMNKGAANFVAENNTVTNVTNYVEEIIAAKPDNVQSVINGAQAGDVITLLPGEYGTIVAKSDITIKGTAGAVVGCIKLNNADNVVIKNITFDAAGAQAMLNTKGKVQTYANIFNDNASAGDGSNYILIEDCTFVGTYANGGAAIGTTRQTLAADGNFTVRGCTFMTEGAYYNIYTYYSGNNGYFVIENNTFNSKFAGGGAIYLGRYQSSVPVELKNNTFENAETLGDVFYLQDHSSYGVSYDESGNTFNG